MERIQLKKEFSGPLSALRYMVFDKSKYEKILNIIQHPGHDGDITLIAEQELPKIPAPMSIEYKNGIIGNIKDLLYTFCLAKGNGECYGACMDCCYDEHNANDFLNSLIKEGFIGFESISNSQDIEESTD